jgi:hypothetical protein
VADRQDFKDRVVGALGAVLMVALGIGVVIGLVTYAAVKMTGLTGGDDTPPEAAPAATSSAEPSPTSEESTSPTPSPSPSPSSDEQDRDRGKKSGKKDSQLTLSASPKRVGSMDRIDLSGRYPGHDGANLAVQRFEGGHWGGFPVSATVRNGRFSTWVASGQSGRNKFRVVDTGSGRTSPAVSVIVG